jgi:hypothetical protein
MRNLESSRWSSRPAPILRGGQSRAEVRNRRSRIATSVVLAVNHAAGHETGCAAKGPERGPRALLKARDSLAARLREYLAKLAELQSTPEAFTSSVESEIPLVPLSGDR